MGNLGVVPLVCSRRFLAFPLRAFLTLRALRVFPVRELIVLLLYIEIEGPKVAANG